MAYKDIIKEQWQLFKVSKDIFEDPGYSWLESFVSELLTSCQRSAIKQKASHAFFEVYIVDDHSQTDWRIIQSQWQCAPASAFSLKRCSQRVSQAQ